MKSTAIQSKNNQPKNRQSILITGCSSGIGYCVAKGLHEEGYTVYATARKKEDVQILREEGLNCSWLDYTDSNSIKETVDSVLEQSNGQLYALFNNGAYGQPGAVEDLSLTALREQFETNVFGWHELTTQVIPVMRAQGYGRIIQNSSVLGLVAMKYRGAYNATKFALEGLTDTLRMELAGTNIYLSLIEPGPIESRFRVNALQMFKRYIDPVNTPHAAHYQKVLERLNQKGPAAPFTLPPEAVLKKVRHALRATGPRYATLSPFQLTFLTA